MELSPIPAAQWADWYQNEFRAAFPPCERKPLKEMEALRGAGRYELLGLWDGAERLGFASLCSHPDYPGYILLDYLAVDAGRRGQGLGSAILALLGKRLAGTAVLVEAELPVPGGDEAENALRRRRLDFYRRNGLVPVYPAAGCGMALQTFVLGPMGDLEALMAAHRGIYGPERTDILVPLAPGAVPPPSPWGADGEAGR